MVGREPDVPEFVVVVGSHNPLADCDGAVKFFADLAYQGIFMGFAELDLSTGELP